MRTVTLEVASRETVTHRALAAFGGKKQGSYLSFATPELRRDVKAVHGDVHALLDVGILRRTTKGKIEFPYDAVRVNFTLKAA